MPDCGEKLRGGHTVVHLRTDRLVEKMKKFKICSKCAERDIYDIAGALTGWPFTDDEKTLFVKTDVLGEQEIGLYDGDGRLIRSLAIRMRKK